MHSVTFKDGFYVEKLCQISSQRLTLSAYKSRNTFKLFISTSPVQHINFVSIFYTGSVSDKQITKQCSFLEQLINPGDVVGQPFDTVAQAQIAWTRTQELQGLRLYFLDLHSCTKYRV